MDALNVIEYENVLKKVVISEENENLKDQGAHEKDIKKLDQAKEMNGKESDVENSLAPPDEGKSEGVEEGENAFTINIVVPGSEPFEMPVSSMELVQEIYQILIDREDTCHRTCFSLQLEGVTLDNFMELKSVPGLKENSTLKVVEELYTVREARIHVRHIRDLLKSTDMVEGYMGTECNSPSLLNVVTAGNMLQKKSSKTPIETQQDYFPPPHLLPRNKDRPLTPLHPIHQHLRGPQCVKVLTFSGWNPPPGGRRMKGDLLYLSLTTLEAKRYHITASTLGFYLNQSTIDDFNPQPVQPKHVFHSLVDLLGNISPIFKKNFQQLLKIREQKHPFERVATPYQTYSWLSPCHQHTYDYIRSEDAFSSRLGYEEHIPGQTRDWNEELQTTRELPSKHLHERLIRERTIFKVHSDFVVAASRGAQMVIDGNIMAINPGEDTKMQMFLWNNIFLSLGFDVKDHFKNFGGDHAAYTAPGCDLQGVKAYASVDVDGLYTLGTVVVDYRGYRVTAQSIIPGILEKEQEQSVVYGSIDFGKTIVTHDDYAIPMKKAATALKIRTHKVLNSKEEEVELYSSVECKGIIGNDNRHYILDLLRTFPPDVNFLPVEADVIATELRQWGFPRHHPHKLASLRRELVDHFVENRYLFFLRNVTHQFQEYKDNKHKHQNGTDTGETKEGVEKNAGKATEEAKKLVQKVAGEIKSISGVVAEVDKNLCIDISDGIDTLSALTGLNNGDMNGEADKNSVKSDINGGDINGKDGINGDVVDEVGKVGEIGGVVGGAEETKKMVARAARLAGSLVDDDLVITFNNDLFQQHVNHSTQQPEQLEREKKLVVDAAAFVVTTQIPAFVTDCLEHIITPIDHFSLTTSLHNAGINARYLGIVATLINKHHSLSYVYSIVVSSLILRCAKHIYKTYMQGVDAMNLSSSISHYLNCLLASHHNPSILFANDEKQKKKSKRRQKGLASNIASDSTEWCLETPRSLWRKVVDECESYYRFKIEGDSIDSVVEKYSIQKVSLLRGFCKVVGVQLCLKEYAMDNKTKQAFHDDDVHNVYPLVKHIDPLASDAHRMLTAGQSKIHKGLLQEGYELVVEALNLFNNVYGAMHPKIISCLRLIARLNYIMGDYNEALIYQQRAVLMSERILGVDHADTINEYVNLGMYSFAAGQVVASLRLFYRALYLILVCVGELHPDVAVYYTNIGLILHAVLDFELSLKYLTKALELNSRFYGSDSLKCAFNYHLIARTYSCKGDFRSALHSEKESYTIYEAILGENDDRTVESSDCLKHLTTQAVKFQKTVNQLSKGEHIKSISSLQIHTPSPSNILETLNLVNGILFIHISQENVDKLREEMLRQPSLKTLDESSNAKSEPTLNGSTNGQDNIALD